MCETSAKLILSDDEPPFSTRFDDHYYSRHDGRAECVHVFIDGNDVQTRWTKAERFTIGELGFGTGLNFLETWARWREDRPPGAILKFVSIEAFPLTQDEARTALAAWPELGELAEIMLEQWDALDAPVMLDDQTSLHVVQHEAMQAVSEFPNDVDVWYLDGFSPAKNPDMWSEDLMRAIYDRTAPGGTFASYTAAGWVRRNLEASGFTVEKQKGFGTKRDMIAGRKAGPET
ncbi:MAG: tRNA (5-methylaminomethyl-2-thiouridine)(34)-methyltransferase MnmD [Pseudomonadota bacterium]